MTRRASTLAVLVASLAGCVGAPGRSSEPVVYGEDDRLEVYASPDEQRVRARESIVAIVPAHFLSGSDPVQLTAEVPLAADLKRGDDEGRLCPDVPFADQPSAALCGGTLIADDLVLTAAHCVPTDADCRGRRFVFDFAYDAEATPAVVERADVYECAGRVVFDDVLDYAVVRLDRAVDVARRPAPLDPTILRDLAPGDALVMYGFPDGVPLKIDAGARFLRDEGAGFRATLDAFAGGSGSGVFRDGHLVGLVSRGQPDFVLDPERGCYEINVLPASGADVPGELAVYADVALDALCARDSGAGPCGDPDAWIAGRVARGGCGVAAARADGPLRWPGAVAVVAVAALARRRRS